MSHPTRLLVVAALFLAPPVRAQDKPPVQTPDKRPAKADDARRDALVRAGYTPVPLTVTSEGMLYVEGTVGTENVRFRLGSGEPMTVIDFSVARRLGLTLGDAVAEGVGGSYAGRVAEYPGLTLGPFAPLKDWTRLGGMAVDLSRLDTRPTGLLAGDVLDSWGAVVDYPGRTLYLRPRLVNAWPRLAGTWTVTSWQEDGGARKLDPKVVPTLTFADRRFKLTDGGQTREYVIEMVPANDKGVNRMALFDPKQENERAPVVLADSLIKVAGDRMTVCLVPDLKKATRAPTGFAAPKGSGYVLLELTRTSPPADPKPADPFRELMVKDGFTAVPLEDMDGRRVVTAEAGGSAFRLLVDTGSNASMFDGTALDKWGGKRLETLGPSNGSGPADVYYLRGLTFGTYNTRRAWMLVFGARHDPAKSIKTPAEQNRSLHGQLGNLELLASSAVIDFNANTLYLRPSKETVWPELEGKWVGVAWESEGQRGRFAPGDGSIEFKGGRVRFNTKDGTNELGFHLQDLGTRYQVGLFDPEADELADGFKYSSSGLLKWSGNTLTLVMQQKTRKMPRAFAAPQGSGLLLVEYERAK